MVEFSGKTALVTGGTSGIGLAVVRKLVDGGAHVFVVGRKQAALDAVAAELGDAVTPVAGDVVIAEDIEKIFDAVQARGAGLDIVFANAGSGTFAALGDITWEHYATTFNTNIGGLIETVQGALPYLSSGSSVVLTGSNVDVRGRPRFSVYTATKAAVRSLARSWAAELTGRGVRVNVVAPGPVGTPGLSELTGGPDNAAAAFEGIASGVPMGRLGDPDEIADAVLFLASSRSSYVTGSVLYVDGGISQI